MPKVAKPSSSAAAGSSSSQASSSLAAARKALAEPITFEDFLAKLSAKDRTNAERHAVALADQPKHLELWQRLARALMTLAPHAIKFNGQHSVQLYVADGKYRMQVFAMEDLRDGKVTLYCGNVVEQATDAGLIAPRRDTDPPNTVRVGGTDDLLNLETLDGQTPNPAPFYKDMLGWNRKAVRITLPSDATNVQIEAAELLCALSAAKWKTVPTAT